MAAAAEIAILDPTPRTSRQVELVLSAAGYRVATFASPDAAREGLVTSGARLLVAELMLPAVDGLEFWAEIQRRRPPGGELGLLCFSAVSWGYVDLAALLGQRFGAGWLAKPALRSELVARVEAAIGPPAAGRPARAPGHAPDFRLGVDDASRVDMLAGEFEKRMASVPLSGARSHVRSHLPHEVKVNEHGGWVARPVQDISSGGLFIESDRPPPVGETVDLLLDIPTLRESVRLRGRVLRRIADDGASPEAGPGYAVELIQPSEEVRQALELFVRERLNQEGVPQPLPSEESVVRRRPRAPATVLLIAPQTGDLLARAGLLHRREIELVAVPTLARGEEVVRARQPALVVVHERMLDVADPLRSLTRLSQAVISKDKLILLGVGLLRPSVVASLCGALVPADISTEGLLDQLRGRLGLAARNSPRIYHRTRTRADTTEQGFDADMIDLGMGGALLKGPVNVPVGAQVTLTFDLPEVPAITCGGHVVRSQRNRLARHHVLAVAFTSKDARATEALRRFVQSHLPFTDFLAWLSAAAFPR